MLTFTFRRVRRFLLFVVLTLGLLVACNTQQPANQSSQSVSSKPLIVGSSPWPGFSAHYIAVEKDFFKAEGITVEDNYFQVATDVNTALAAGKLDLAWTGIPDMVTMAGRDPSLRLVMLSDYSNGADGILARNVSNPQDIKGKQIAWESLPLQALLLRKYLESGGMTEKDVELRVIPAAEAASAFAAKKVDVAVTYEPWLTKAAKEGQGTVVFSSKNSNIIPDGLVSKQPVLDARKADIQAYLRAIDNGVQFIKENPEDANAIIAQKLGVTAKEVPDLLNSVRIFTVAENKTVVFNPDDPMNVIDSLKFAAKTGKEIKIVDSSVNPDALYDDTFVKGS